MPPRPQVAVPDIGDFDDVPVIEILVAVGDTVAAEDPLVTLESDKATMDVPAPFAGVVRELPSRSGMGRSGHGADGIEPSGDGGPPGHDAPADSSVEQVAAPTDR